MVLGIPPLGELLEAIGSLKDAVPIIMAKIDQMDRRISRLEQALTETEADVIAAHETSLLKAKGDY
jgi:hypothetical protein